LAAQAQIGDPGYSSGRSISADTGGTQVVRAGLGLKCGSGLSAATVGTRASAEARGRRRGRAGNCLGERLWLERADL